MHMKITSLDQISKHLIECFVVGEFVGSCTGMIYCNSKAKIMIIDDVLVSENKRGLGYGAGLVREAIEFAKANEVDSVELTVNPENIIARNLYRKMGFEETDKKYCRRILNVK